MQTKNRVFDDLAKLATGAAGAAMSIRSEAEGALKAFLDRRLASLDLVSREEFEVVRDMAVKAREENERLFALIGALESQRSSGPKAAAPKTRASKRKAAAKAKE